MTTRVSVQPLEEHAYAVVVTEGSDTTHHRVVLPPELRDDLVPTGSDERTVVRESVDYLLDRQPGDALPHDIDLAALRHEDGAFFPELQRRLSR